MNRFTEIAKANWKPLAVYAGVALLLLLPLLGSGYILTLDMVFTPRVPMPQTVTSSYLFHVLLHALTFVLPSQVIEKGLLVSIVLLAGVGMHRLLRQIMLPIGGSGLAAYVGGLFYIINPYTYSRFMAGQYSVLLGYALVPFFFAALLRLLANLSVRRAIVVVCWAVVVSIVSI